MQADQAMQFIAVVNIGTIAAQLFGHGEQSAGRTIEIAGDSFTGAELTASLSRAARIPIS